MWFTLLVSLVFVALSVFIAVAEPSELPTALATGSFFGLCALVAVMMLRRRFLERRSLGTPAHVEVVGGVPIPYRSGMLRIGAGLVAVVGALGVWGGTQIAPTYVVTSGLLLAIGAALLVADLAGLSTRPALQFEPDGLWLVERGFRYRIDWDGLDLGVGNLNDHVVVSLLLLDREAVLDSIRTRDGSPADRWRTRLARRFDRTERWNGAPILVLPWQYGQDPVRFTQALLRYVREPESRAELRAPVGLPKNERVRT